MRYVLDASVAVASLRSNEPSHAAAVARVAPLIKGVDEIVVPSIFRVELGSALARAGFGDQADRFVEAFVAQAELVTIGPERARRAQRIAQATRLRAADAIYVWLAAREDLPLVTLDRELPWEGGWTVMRTPRLLSLSLSPLFALSLLGSAALGALASGGHRART